MALGPAALHLPPGLSGPIGVALSGGGDSVALLHLLRAAGHRVEAATVDHGLRPESADEAAAVAADCARIGIPHRVLPWNHGATVPGNLMEAARLARRALLSDWAAERGLAAVALGHTADDQAEALLIGLSRAAGIDGLCGMRADWTTGGVRWLRPMLGITRSDLRLWLTGQAIAWIEDPSNGNDRYLRARVRKALATLSPLGLTPDRLAASAAHLAQARAALDAAVAEAAARVCHEEAGALRIDAVGFAALPEEIARRLLRAAILWLTGADHAPRAAALARLAQAVVQGRDATLAGCRLKRGWLARQPGWPDPRWQMAVPPGLERRALGAEGLRACPDWRASGLPRHVLEVTPALWQGGTLIAAPSAAFGLRTDATCTPAFGAFLLSH